MKKNIKTVKIFIPDSKILNLIKGTPALSKLSRLNLVAGENIENVSHAQYSNLKRMYSLLGCTITDITNNTN